VRARLGWDVGVDFGKAARGQEPPESAGSWCRLWGPRDGASPLTPTLSPQGERAGRAPAPGGGGGRELDVRLVALIP
jgi:hypothetical protein